MADYTITITNQCTAEPSRIPPTGGCKTSETVSFQKEPSGTAVVTFDIPPGSPFSENPVNVPASDLPITARPSVTTTYTYKVTNCTNALSSAGDGGGGIIIVDGTGPGPQGHPGKRTGGKKAGAAKKSATAKRSAKAAGKSKPKAKGKKSGGAKKSSAKAKPKKRSRKK